MLLLLIATFPAFAQNETRWFPEEITGGVIGDYIHSRTLNDKVSAREEYLKILSFIEEIIIALQVNTERRFTASHFSERRPSIVNDSLTIVERDVGVSFIWNNEFEVYMEFPDICTFTIMVETLYFVRIYNHLLDFWYSKTGELLSDHLDEVAQVYNIREFIQRAADSRQYNSQ
jgi:hypothetical protein